MTGAGSGWHALLEGLLLFEHELMAFAAFWFCVGLLDELGIDLAWLWLRLTGKARTLRLPVGYGADPLSGHAAVMIPAYQEAPVIGATIAHMLAAWPQRELTIFVGCYRNDPATPPLPVPPPAATPGCGSWFTVPMGRPPRPIASTGSTARSRWMSSGSSAALPA